MSQAVAHDFLKKTRTDDVMISENVDFAGMLLSENVLLGLITSGFKRPSPIQLKAIPLGRCGLDLIVQAKSGTGKTVVFTVISLESIQLSNASSTQVLVLAPTREIAVQILEVMNSVSSKMTGVYCQMFIGGTPLNQDKQKLKQCHIAIGTPGRIKQLIETDIFNPESVRVFILDEADKLLEDSFKEQINWIYSMLPENKQMIALSATYPEYMAEQLTLYMRDPTFVRLNSQDPALLGIKQYFQSVPFHPFSHKVFANKTKLMVKLLSSITFHQCLVFSNLQTRAQSLCDILNDKGWPSECIAGCLEQQQRLAAMEKLKTFKCRILISTDLTSRGIDAENVNLVINLDIPHDHETYLHRIGRAGRFGSFGAAVTLISGEEEKGKLRSLEEKCNTTIHLLPDPIPTDLVERDVPVDLSALVTTQQIKTRENICKGHDLQKINGGGIQTSDINNKSADATKESSSEKVNSEDYKLRGQELSKDLVDNRTSKDIVRGKKSVENNINGRSVGEKLQRETHVKTNLTKEDTSARQSDLSRGDNKMEAVMNNEEKPSILSNKTLESADVLQKSENSYLKQQNHKTIKESNIPSEQQIKKQTSKKGKQRKSYRRDDQILMEEFGGGSSFEIFNTDMVILERPTSARKSPTPMPRPVVSVPDIPIPDFSKPVSSSKAWVPSNKPQLTNTCSKPPVPNDELPETNGQPPATSCTPPVTGNIFPKGKDPLKSMATSSIHIHQPELCQSNKLTNVVEVQDIKGVVFKDRNLREKKVEVLKSINNPQISTDSESKNSNAIGRKIITASRRRKMASTNNPISQIDEEVNRLSIDKKDECLSVKNGESDLTVQKKDKRLFPISTLQVNSKERTSDSADGLINDQENELLKNEEKLSHLNLTEVSIKLPIDTGRLVDTEIRSRSLRQEEGSTAKSMKSAQENHNKPFEGHTYTSALENYKSFLQRCDDGSSVPRQSNLLNLLLKKCCKTQEPSLNSKITLENVTAILKDLDLRGRTKPTFRESTNESLDLHKNVQINADKISTNDKAEKTLFVSNMEETASKMVSKKRQPSTVLHCNKGSSQTNLPTKVPSKTNSERIMKEIKKPTEVARTSSVQGNSPCTGISVPKNNFVSNHQSKLKDPTLIDQPINSERKASHIDKRGAILRSSDGDVKKVVKVDSSDDEEDSENEETSTSSSSDCSSDSTGNESSSDSDSDYSESDGTSIRFEDSESGQSNTLRGSPQKETDSYNLDDGVQGFSGCLQHNPTYPSTQSYSATYPSAQGFQGFYPPDQGQTQSNYHNFSEFRPETVPANYMHPYYAYMGYPPWCFPLYSYGQYSHPVNQSQFPADSASINNFGNEMKNAVAGTQKMKELLKCQFDYLYYMKKN